jgi:hypothetical protein
LILNETIRLSGEIIGEVYKFVRKYFFIYKNLTNYIQDILIYSVDLDAKSLNNVNHNWNMSTIFLNPIIKLHEKQISDSQIVHVCKRTVDRPDRRREMGIHGYTDEQARTGK